MALDHVREFLQAEQFDPLDLSKTTVPLFLTRWVTHFCPSVFVLLAGVGAALGIRRDQPRWMQARFLFLRGLWLVFLELTVVHIGWFFNLQINAALGQVIWAIGWSMVGLAALCFLPDWFVATFGVILIAGHNAFDGIPPSQFGSLGWLWSILHARGFLAFGHFSIYIAYPIIPWVGVMAVGFGFAHLLRLPSPKRGRAISCIGLVLIGAFVVLRGLNLYGDPNPWQPQASPGFSMLSILNCQKYPPSLSFLLMTLGPTFLVWPLLERWRGRSAEFLITFGRVPLFFYLVHLYVIHGLTFAIVYWQTKSVPDWLWNFPPGHAGPGNGLELPYVYLVWIGVVLAHYPLCRMYGALKRRYPASLLRFL